MQRCGVRPSVHLCVCQILLCRRGFRRVCCCEPGAREISISCCTACAAAARRSAAKASSVAFIFLLVHMNPTHPTFCRNLVSPILVWIVILNHWTTPIFVSFRPTDCNVAILVRSCKFTTPNAGLGFTFTSCVCAMWWRVCSCNKHRQLAIKEFLYPGRKPIYKPTRVANGVTWRHLDTTPSDHCFQYE